MSDDIAEDQGRFVPFGAMSITSIELLDTALTFEKTLGLINIRMYTTLRYPPRRHDCTVDIQQTGLDNIHVRLSEIFDQDYHEIAKRFLYYLLIDGDLALEMKREHGVSLAYASALGGNSIVWIEKKKFCRFDHNCEILYNAWRHFKILSRIICTF